MDMGALLRDEGMRRSVRHANARNPAWSADAEALSLDYIHCVEGEFTTEDLREYAVSRGLAEPPDRRAWGAITAGIARDGAIAKAGYREHSDPVRHKGISTVWRKL